MTTAPRQDRRGQAERWGRRAEWLAGLYLRCKGYRLVRTRFRSPVGEIDLIAMKGSVLAFVEVKARRQREAAIEAVLPQTRQRIARAAHQFLSRNAHYSTLDIRYDIIAVSREGVLHLRDAWRD